MNNKLFPSSFFLAIVLSLYFIAGKTSIFVAVGFLFFSFCCITKKGNKESILFLILLFIFYAIINAYTERNISVTFTNQLSLLGPQFIMAVLFAAAITTKEELFLSIKYTTYVLFVSFIIIGFYQYFTHSLLASWVNEENVAAYQETFDLQRLTSLTEMHPANAANGILFVIILLLENVFKRKIYAIVMLTAALAALFLTFTRMSYATFILVFMYYLYRQYSYYQKRYLIIKRIIGVGILIVIIVFAFDIHSMLSQSTRMGDEANVIYRFVQWGAFIQNIDQFTFGVGRTNVNLTSSTGNSYENYFMQTYAALGIYSVVLYTLIFWKFIKNFKNYTKEMESLRLSIVLLMIAFIINMMTSVESENLFFLVFGLSFAFYNVNKRMEIVPSG